MGGGKRALKGDYLKTSVGLLPCSSQEETIRPLGSIRVKITLGIVALLVVMTIVTAAVAIERSEDVLRDQITLTHQARANTAAQEVEWAMDRAKSMASAMAVENGTIARPINESDLDPHGSVPEDHLVPKRVELEHAHQLSALFDGALILDRTGHVLIGEPYALQHELNTDPPPSMTDRLRRIAEFTAEVPVPVVHAGGAEEQWTVSARLSHEGQVWGVLVLTASTQALADLIGTTGDDGSFFVILDRAGTVLIGPPGLPPGTNLSPQMAVLQQAERSSGIFTHEGTDYLATVTGLGEETQWSLIVAQNSKVAFASVDAMLFQIVMVAGLVIVIGVMTGLLVANRITAPVVRLKAAAERVARGEYGTQVRTTTKDELAELASAFNLMSARLLEEHQRLQRHQASLEATVKERTAELAEKNEELEAFVYATSHDLRTPLIALDWLMEELEGALKDDDGTVAETLERMRANIDGMERLIADLLELSRIGRTEGEPEGVMLLPIVESVLENLGHGAKERNTTFHVEFEDDVVIEADPRRMEQVFHNLLSNAIKYGRRGGNVYVRANPIGDAKRPWKWRIEVADDGPGIAPEQRETVFQLFRRGHHDQEEEVEGTGIGLALVRKIVRAYGGEIKATRANEGGALFWFTLNASRPGTSPTNAPETEAQKAPGEPPAPRRGPLARA